MQTRPAAGKLTQITLKPARVAGGLAAVAVFLVLASIASQWSRYLLGHDQVFGLVRLFDVGAEQNIPSLFSVFLLFFAALLLAVITVFKKTEGDRDVSRWAVLAAGFTYMAIDEGASIHELLITPVRGLLGPGAPGIFYYGWVVPAMVVVFALAFFFAGFLLRLPGRTRYIFIAGAVLYLGGAIGVEMYEGHYHRLYGYKNFTYSMIVTVEESLEMAGVIVFIYALLRYIADARQEVRTRFGE